MTRRYAHCSLYSTKRETPYWRPVLIKDGAGILGFLPNLQLKPLFDNSVSSNYPKPFIRSAIVMVPGHRFLVVGYRHPNRPINPTISKLGTDLVWRGEVAVFHIGWTVPYLASPGTKKLRDDAVVVYVQFIKHV